MNLWHALHKWHVVVYSQHGVESDEQLNEMLNQIRTKYMGFRLVECLPNFVWLETGENEMQLNIFQFS